MSEPGLLTICGLLILVAGMIIFFPFNRQHYQTQLVVFILLIAGSSFGYWQWGSQQKWVDFLKQQDMQQRAQAVMASLSGPQELIDKLKNHLQYQPDSARGWYLLGRLYASQNQWNHAYQSFSKARKLDSEDEAITVNYAIGLWQTLHQKFTPDVRQLFQLILKKNPNQPDALSMLAMDAYQQHDYHQAIDYWSALLLLVPQDSSESKVIRKAILKSRHMLENTI